MKKIAIEMSTNLRQVFKATCAVNNTAMKKVLIDEVNNILTNNLPCYHTSRPKMGEGMCVLCLNVDEDFIKKVKHRKDAVGDKIRDVYITAIINYLLDNNIQYDYSQDINEE